MKKLNPHFLVMMFAVSVAMRTGYLVYDNYSDIFTANAAETQEKKTQPVEESNGDVQTVKDKILMPKNEKIKKNKSSSDKMNKVTNKANQDMCITGVMLKNALKQLEYFDKREAEIIEQQRLLEISDRRIREQVAKLKLIKDEIVESTKLADSAINKESKRLISIYEKMKPKEAANIFNEMSADVAAELLRTMKEDQSSQILSKMNPKNAYKITLSLASGIKKTKKKYESINQE